MPSVYTSWVMGEAMTEMDELTPGLVQDCLLYVCVCMYVLMYVYTYIHTVRARRQMMPYCYCTRAEAKSKEPCLHACDCLVLLLPLLLMPLMLLGLLQRSSSVDQRRPRSGPGKLGEAAIVDVNVEVCCCCGGRESVVVMTATSSSRG